LIGVNNRNLATMTVDLDTCRRLRPLIPSTILVVAESGFSRPDEVRDLYRAGLDAFLIGTTLMKANDPASVLSGLAQAGGRECHA
jgi:indole-3-glycerol phosphate synthase